MITDNYRKITAINGVAAGGVATVQLPLSSRIKDLFLVYKANAAQNVMEADLTKIVLNINGQPRRSPSAAQIFVKEKHAGRTVTAGIVPIRFRDPSASSDEWEDKTALNTFRVAAATLEVAISAAATAPTLEVYACYDGIDDKNDFLAVWDTVTFGNQGAGTKTKTDLVRAGILSRIDFFGTTNLPSEVKIRADDRQIYELNTALINTFAADYGYSVQSNHLAVLTTQTRRPQEGLFLDPLSRFEVEYTTGASGDITAIVERIVKL